MQDNLFKGSEKYSANFKGRKINLKKEFNQILQMSTRTKKEPTLDIKYYLQVIMVELLHQMGKSTNLSTPGTLNVPPITCWRVDKT